MLELCTAVLAYIMERAQLAVLPTGHDDQCAQHMKVESEEVSGFRNIRFPSNHQPRTFPNPLLLSFVVVFRDVTRNGDLRLPDIAGRSRVHLVRIASLCHSSRAPFSEWRSLQTWRGSHLSYIHNIVHIPKGTF